MNAAILLKSIDSGVRDLVNSDRWAEYLKVQARFHKYSPFNAWCIFFAKPDATRVAGFHKWLELHRYVKKGEHGIPILAPVSYTKREKDSDGNDIEKRALNFRVVYVFDVSQTDGEPLPEVASDLVGNERANLDNLIGVAKSWGVTVNLEEDMPLSTKGYVLRDFDGIVHLNAKCTPAQQAKTLAHELTHALLHCKKADGQSESEQETTRQVGELEAESSAYIVLNALGFEAGTYSFGYLALWANGDPDKLSSVIRASAKRIQGAAEKIIAACAPKAREQDGELAQTA